MSSDGQSACGLWGNFFTVKGDPREERSFLFFTGIVKSAYDARNCFFCLVIKKKNITVLKKAQKKVHTIRILLLLDTS